jgi:hypothetical protein
MTAETESTASKPTSLRCWCCDREFGEVNLVRLGARPEVTICLDCARFVHRRALARRYEHRRTPLGAARRGVHWIRTWVIEHGWHQCGRLGAILRRLDRFLP